MGAGVSDWRLANAVSRTAQLGVVSSVALDTVLARRLQDGDPGGHMRYGLSLFPFPEVAARILDRYYIAGGKPRDTLYKLVPMLARNNSREANELLVAANFVEVTLARQGHANPVGVNCMEKLQMPLLASLYGCMLAGVAYVIVGAGIPLKVPGVLDSLARGEAVSYPLSVAGAQPGDDCLMHFDPAALFGQPMPPLLRPKFLAVISSNTLATTMLRRANGPVDGFVIEGSTAGGHNAPPRGPLQLSARGEAIYGERDRIELEKIRQLGLPFWLAGGYATPAKLAEARAIGATGVQLGTAFALCRESGLREDYKAALIVKIQSGAGDVFTDPRSSPTGFPFKAAILDGTLAEASIYAARERRCDIGLLREAYRTTDGAIAYRCAAEPESDWQRKGGAPEATCGRKCLCNCLLADIGLGQTRRDGYVEPGLVTTGDDLACVRQFLTPSGDYAAADVIATLMHDEKRVELPPTISAISACTRAEAVPA